MFDYVWHSIKVLIRSSNPQSGSHHQIRLTKQILLFASQSFLDRFLFLTAFHHSAISQHAKWPHPVLGCSGQVAQHSCGRRFNHRPCWIATTKCYRAFCFKHLAFREIKQEFEGWIVKFKEHQRTSQFPQHPCLIVGGSGPWWFFKNPPTTDITY